MTTRADTSLHVVIAGASGFLGTHLTDALLERGHDVTALVRRPTTANDRSEWDPYTGRLDRTLIESADVVVNLAGSKLLGNPHSRRFRRTLRQSRILTTHVLAVAVAASSRPPTFIAQSASGWYGDHGSDAVTERSESRGSSFMTVLARDWEDAADPARRAGARVCHLRTVPVMQRGSLVFQILVPLFRLGLGGRLGDGRQYFPVISLRDWVGGTVHLIEHGTVEGPVNLSCATPPTNAEFTRAFARQLHRPAALSVPAPAIRLAAGPLSQELLGSMDVRPEVLERSGYQIRDRDVTSVLDAAFS